MKTQPHQSNSKLASTLAKGIPVAILAAALPLSAQLVIEAGPDAVQISSRDGEVEVVSTPTSPTPGALQAKPGGPVTEIDDSITVRPNQLESTTVNVPTKAEPRTPIADVEPTPNPVVTTPDPVVVTDPTDTVVVSEPTGEAVPTAEVVVGPEVAERKAELARELSIQDTATGATLGMTTEGLYTEGTSAFDPLLESQLSMIAEYIRLSQNDMVEVTYHYVPDRVSEELAWQRSLAFVNWMKTKGLTVEQVYSISDPEAVVVETPDPTNPIAVDDTELVGRLVISMN